ncbi:MAG: hypothetical protein COA44_08890 [Arcobacter sp.]|nr:MAG: hypothetical protein COA44_08890 [Arcobacter sp.]
MLFKIFFITLFFVLNLHAIVAKYTDGLSLYKAQKYDKAFVIILDEAKKGNKAAQYRIGEMYETGKGIKLDYKQAMNWYKRSSSKFAYIEKDLISKEDNKSLLIQVQDQFGNDSIVRGGEFALAKMDTNTPETKKLMKSLTSGGFFGLQAYNTNFYLPISYAHDKPTRINSLYHRDDPNSPIPSDITYSENVEAQFQLSLKKQISYDFFGLNEFIYFAYTQKVWWQIYADSAPFRETNYLPEFFMTVPSSFKMDEAIGLKAIKYGFIHESNGQEGYRSRSWNRVYLTGMWQWGNLFAATRAWYRLNENEKPADYDSLGPIGANSKGDDNPDIAEYLGYGDIRLSYLNGKSQYEVLLRNNLRLNSQNKGAIEFSWSYPFFDSPNTFWYIKLFNGYGESLIDYDNEVTKASIGFSFSRGLF